MLLQVIVILSVSGTIKKDKFPAKLKIYISPDEDNKVKTAWQMH